MKNLFFICCILLANSTLADPPDDIRAFKVGNGGDSVVLEFKEILRNVYAQLEQKYKSDEEFIENMTVKRFSDILNAPIRSYDEVTLKGVSLDAVNDPIFEKEIALSRPRWNSSSNLQRYRIVLHESLLYLGNDDVEGRNSADILNMLIVVPFHADGGADSDQFDNDLTRPEGRGLQISRENAHEFALQAADATETLWMGFSRQRDFSVQAANGAVGAKERGFLNDEFQAYKEEMLRIIRTSKFEDMYTNTHHYMFDGFDFSVPIEMFHGRYYYLKNFDFPSLESIGKVYSSIFEIYPIEPLMAHSFAIRQGDKTWNFELGSNDDLVSPDDPVHSSISIARRINANNGLISAQVLDTSFRMENLDIESWKNKYGELSGDDLVINGVNIVGSLHNAEDFAYLINNFSSRTGIKAEVISEDPDTIEIYAEDGRNISLKSNTNSHSDNFATVSGIKIVPDETNIIYGRVELTSFQAFNLIDPDGLFGKLDANYEVSIPELHNYKNSTINTQEGAQDTITVMDQVLHDIKAYQISLDILLHFCPSPTKDPG